jgi:hypothetical protein
VTPFAGAVERARRRVDSPEPGRGWARDGLCMTRAVLLRGARTVLTSSTRRRRSADISSTLHEHDRPSHVHQRCTVRGPRRWTTWARARSGAALDRLVRSVRGASAVPLAGRNPADRTRVPLIGASVVSRAPASASPAVPKTAHPTGVSADRVRSAVVWATNGAFSGRDGLQGAQRKRKAAFSRRMERFRNDLLRSRGVAGRRSRGAAAAGRRNRGPLRPRAGGRPATAVERQAAGTAGSPGQPERRPGAAAEPGNRGVSRRA